jgi:hypothetical protein
MKSLSGVIVGAAIVVVVIIGAVWYQKNAVKNTTEHTSGNLYIGVTDATTDINNVDAITLSIKKVELHSLAKGWVTVSSDSKMYDLLALHASGTTKLYAKESIAVGAYDRARITMGDTTIHTKTNGNVKAYTPADQLVMSMNIIVGENTNTMMKLDVLADKSLHTTSDGKFIFAPVVNAESKNDTTVSVEKDDSMKMTNGTVGSSVSVGIDLDGISKTNFVLDNTSTISVDASLYGMVKFMRGNKTYQDDGKDKDEALPDSSLKLDTTINSSIDNQSQKTATPALENNLKGYLDLETR